MATKNKNLLAIKVIVIDCGVLKEGKKAVMRTVFALGEEMVSRGKCSGAVTGQEDYVLLCLYVL